MLLPLKHSRAWLVVGWAMVALAIAASLTPGGKLPAVGVNDKFGHAFTYTVLAVWFAGIYPRSRYVLIGVGLFLMGIGVEWAQGAMNVGRQSDLRDVVANSVGISIGLVLALLWLGDWAQRLEARLRKP